MKTLFSTLICVLALSVAALPFYGPVTNAPPPTLSTNPAYQGTKPTGTNVVNMVIPTIAPLPRYNFQTDFKHFIEATFPSKGGLMISASQWGIADDADLGMNSQSFGKIQMTKMQSLLDQATNGPLYVWWNVRAGVTNDGSNRGLRLHSNTEIEFAPGCGTILQSNANVAMFQNYNFSSNSIVDSNIFIHGPGILNGNNSMQQHDIAGVGWVMGIEFIGVQNLTVKDLQILKARTFASYVCNFTNVLYSDLYVDAGITNPALFNYDGPHFDGPGRYVTVNNTRVKTQDDGISFCGNEPLNGNVLNFTPYFTGGSNTDITDITVDNCTFEDSAFGIRLLSSTARINRVHISNIHGRTQNNFFVIDNFTDNQAQMTPPGQGNFGSILIDGFDGSITRSGYKQAYIFVSANIEDLQIRNVSRNNWDFYQAVGYYPTIEIAGGTVQSVSISGYDAFSAANTNNYFQIWLSGTVGCLNLFNNVFNNPTSGNERWPVVIYTGGVINTLNANGNTICGYAGLIKNGGTIVNSNEFNTVRTKLRPAWSMTAGSAAVWQNTLALSNLWFYQANDGVATACLYPTNQVSGNYTLSTVITAISNSAACEVQLLARATNVFAADNSTLYYFLQFGMGSGHDIRLGIHTGGNEYLIGTNVTGVTISNNLPYQVSWTLSNTNMTGQVFWKSSGVTNYLTPAGAWQTNSINCVSGHDLSILPANLAWGVLTYGNATDSATISSINVQ